MNEKQPSENRSGNTLRRALSRVSRLTPFARSVLEERDTLRHLYSEAVQERDTLRAEVFSLRANLALRYTEAPLWGVSALRLENGILEVEGWAFPPQEEAYPACFTVNGVPFEDISYPLPCDAIGEAFWYVPGAEKSLFTCRTPFDEKCQDSKPFIEIQFARKYSNLPYRLSQACHYPIEERDPFPPLKLRRRVHRGDDEFSFRSIGCTMFMQFQLMLRNLGYSGYDDFTRILDWGCGCGRTTRYFRYGNHSGVTGVDIDAEAIAWCQENLPFAQFLHVPLNPPTELEPESFDLILGLSIFTHLNEPDQFAWLSELQRVAAQNALVLVSTQSEPALCRLGAPELLWRYRQSSGFVDLGANPDLKGVVQEESYRSIYHTLEYIRSRWSEYFEVLLVLPGYFWGYQDLVVLRKR